MMPPERFFCAAASRGRGETIYGTVARVRSWLLVEYPGVWRRNAIEDSLLLSPAVKQYLGNAVDRSILIRQTHRRTGPLRCFHVRCCESPPTLSVSVVDDYEGLPDASAGAQPVGDLLYAVCTHGRHDKCCSKFGIPVYCALRDAVGDRVWECSHVGGDRFAGNVVVFPWGIYYGRVLPNDVPHLIAASERGEVWMPGYRGRCCHGRKIQIAEYFAREQSGRLAIDEFIPVDTGPARVRFRARSDGSIHEVEFDTIAAAIHERLTCSATEPVDIPQYRLARYTHRPG